MGNLISINASVVSCTGRLNAYNSANFFINGRYKFDYEMDNIQVSIENEDDAHIFAVFDELDRQNSTITEELESIYENMESDIGSSLFKLKKCIKSAVDSLGSPSNKNYSFCGFLIAGGKAIAVSTGDSQVFLHRKGNLKRLTTDFEKAMRLRRLGILTEEQAELVSRQQSKAVGDEDGISCSEVIEIKKGDIILLAGNDLGALVEENKINEILSSDRDTWFTSNMIVSEAMQSGGEHNTTSMVIAIEDEGADDIGVYVDNDQTDDIITEGIEEEYMDRKRTTKRRKYHFNKQKALSTLISVTTVLVIIAGIILTAYKIWEIKYRGDDPSNIVDPSPTPVSTQEPEASPDVTPTSTEPSATPIPTPTPTVQPTPTSGTTTYTVVDGDTLFGIAGKFYNSNLMDKVEDIKKANELTSDNIFVGQKLIIPDPDKTE